MDKWTKSKCAGIIKGSMQGKVTKVEKLVNHCLGRKIFGELQKMQRKVGKEFR